MSDEMDGTRPPPEPPSSPEGAQVPGPAAPPMPPMPPPVPPQVVYNVTQTAPSNGMAVAALVLGIIGLVLFFTIWGGILLGILAIVFGALGRSKAKEGAPNRGLATAGFVLGIVAFISSLLFLALILSVASAEYRFDQVGTP